MDAGIIGSGQIGSILARSLAALGHQVRIANSRGPESLSAPAAETGAIASTVEHAGNAPDVVIVTIPQMAVPELPHGLFDGSTSMARPEERACLLVCRVAATCDPRQLDVFEKLIPLLAESLTVYAPDYPPGTVFPTSQTPAIGPNSADHRGGIAHAKFAASFVSPPPL